MKGATVGRLLTGYLLLRQATAALGLTSIAGHAQTVRPLVAPMAEAAASEHAALSEPEREKIKALAAATAVEVFKTAAFMSVLRNCPSYRRRPPPPPLPPRLALPLALWARALPPL